MLGQQSPYICEEENPHSRCFFFRYIAAQYWPTHSTGKTVCSFSFKKKYTNFLWVWNSLSSVRRHHYIKRPGRGIIVSIINNSLDSARRRGSALPDKVHSQPYTLSLTRSLSVFLAQNKKTHKNLESLLQIFTFTSTQHPKFLYTPLSLRKSHAAYVHCFFGTTRSNTFSKKHSVVFWFLSS